MLMSCPTSVTGLSDADVVAQQLGNVGRHGALVGAVARLGGETGAAITWRDHAEAGGGEPTVRF